MERYTVSFLDSAGSVTDSFEFHAGEHLDTSQLTGCLRSACHDQWRGFGLWQGNQFIAAGLGSTGRYSLGECSAASTRLLKPPSPPELTAQPPSNSHPGTIATARSRSVRFLTVGAVATLVFCGTFFVSHNKVQDTARANFGDGMTSGSTNADIEPTSGPNERRAVPSPNEAMLQGFAEYQRIQLSVSEATPGRSVRTGIYRRFPLVEAPSASGPSDTEYLRSPAYFVR